MVALITAICNFISLLLLWICISRLNKKINSVEMELEEKILDVQKESTERHVEVRKYILGILEMICKAPTERDDDKGEE